MKKIICFHLLNDFSGSPKVLSMVIRGLASKGFNFNIHTSRNGVLNQLHKNKNVNIFYNNYTFVEGSNIQFLKFAYIQVYFFIISFKYLRTNCVFYINTLLPVGAALAAFIMRKKIIFHYHENADIKGIAYKVLLRVMLLVSDEMVCVSKYQSDKIVFKKKYIIPNSPTKKFSSDVKSFTPSNNGNVLMLASLKKYKGVVEFIELATMHTKYNFVLVLNALEDEVYDFISNENINVPGNLKIKSRTKDVAPLYKDASIVLNLSNPNLFVETFGLTIIEAMTAGLPVIGPEIGGISELIENGVNGYKADVKKIKKIAKYLDVILENEHVYSKYSQNSKKIALKYNFEKMITSWEKLIKEVINDK